MAHASHPRPDRTLTTRDLDSVRDLRKVADVERAVWGAPDEELVPASLLVVSVKCGAHVIGGFDGDAMVAFVYSFPGRRHGRAIHWSHMLGVRQEYRALGLGRRLKLMQRRRVLADGIDLVEWTFDPLQAVNASFNLSALGAVCREYVADAYGKLEGPLHHGAPTDRLVAAWHLRDPRVCALAADELASNPPALDPDPPRSPIAERGPASLAATPIINPLRRERRWLASADPAAALDDLDSFRLAIPGDFTAMLAEAPAVAQRWREVTRDLFERAFEKRFVAVGFERDPETGGGHYLLSRGEP